MSNESLTCVVGAQTGGLLLVTVDDVGSAVADALAASCAREHRTHWSIRQVAVSDARGADAWLAAHWQDGCDAVLVIASTEGALAAAEVVAALSRRSSAGLGRTRVWPAFVAGGTGELEGFDSALNDLPAGAADAVLMLAAAPTPQAAADALIAWLTVKLPAPPSVLGQLPDVEGSICRYVTLGLAEVAPVDVSEEPASDGSRDDGSDLDLRTRLESVIPESEPGRTIRAKAEDLRSAVAEANPAGVLAATHELVAAATADAGTGLRPVVEDLLGDAAGHLRPGAVIQAQVDSAALTRAASGFVVVASKSGLGRIVSRSKRVSAAQDLVTEADAILSAAEGGWADQAADLGSQAQRLAEERLAAERAEAAAIEAADLRRAGIAKALSSMGTWARANASDVERAWGAGSPAPRRYLIGSPSMVNSVVDLTDDPNPCLRVTTTPDDARVRVLVAQYGLPLAAIR